MTTIAISRIHFPVTTLGPGRRLGVWFQGCSIRCVGCVSADTWSKDTGFTTVAALLDAAEPWLAQADGVTISGGEPFDQPLALEHLLREIRRRATVDVFVYSGHPFAKLAPWLEGAPGLIDALMSEPYIDDAPQTLALRGSDNQVLHLLTETGTRRFGPYTGVPGTHRFDVMFDDDGVVWLAGIPGRGDLRRFRLGLKAAGHQVLLSDVSVPDAAS
jgi:anaerobic ribonucleoside-triphosphate reductase activating protein